MSKGGKSNSATKRDRGLRQWAVWVPVDVDEAAKAAAELDGISFREWLIQAVRTATSKG